MNILHYTIGLPPTRHGGSVQYAYDLMVEQSKTNNVFALICGDTLFRSSKCRFKRHSQNGNIQIYSLTDPLTPTLIYGVSDPDSQHRDIDFDREDIRNFIQSNKIEIMHLHTLMGLHKSIVEFIKGLGVKIIYTSHDFHGICPHYNLLNHTGTLCSKSDGASCALCNVNEPSDNFLRIANSSLYHFIKKRGIINAIKKLKKKSITTLSKKIDISDVDDEIIGKFNQLLNYYKEYFLLIDKFHFNSTQTKVVFNQFLSGIDGKVIPVVTSGIKDNRKPLNIHTRVTFGFIGSLNDYKGFPLLKSIFTQLYNDGYHNFKLKVYSGELIGFDLECPAIEYCPPYKYSEISNILSSLDCIIVPSKWYETFSLVTLEAMGHGIPVIVSNNVGAKDIVSQYNPYFIFSSSLDLKSKLQSILSNPGILESMNDTILSHSWNFDISKHSSEILEFYKSLK